MKKEKPKLDKYGNHVENIIGFIMDVSPARMPEIKSVLRQMIKSHVDRAYVPGCEEVPLKKGEVQAALLNQRGPCLELSKAIKKAIKIINQEENEEKVLFIITDQVGPEEEYECMKAISSDKDEEIQFYLFYYPESEKFTLNRVTRTPINLDNLLKDMVLKLKPDYKFEEKATEEADG